MPNQTAARFVLALLLIPAIQGCQRGDRNPQDNAAFSQPVRSNLVSAVSYPLAYLTGQLLEGTPVQVDLVAPPAGASDQWTPDAQQIQALQKSDLIFANGPGAPFAKWMVRVSLPESRVVHTTDNFSLDEFIRVKDHRVVHRHGPEGEHSHPFMVAETWLDPAMARQQAGEIATALAGCYPEMGDLLQQNLQQLNQALDQIAGQFETIPAGNVISSTPRLKFLTRAAGLQDTHLLWFDWPDESSWQAEGEQAFLDRVKGSGSRCILFDTEPPAWLKQRLQELGYPVHSLDSFSRGGVPAGGADFLQVMQNNLETLQRALSH